jgi:hypothetical protein
VPVFESSRKVQALGSSLALTLPALFVKANGIGKGELTEVYYNLNGVLIVSFCDDSGELEDSLVEIVESIVEKGGRKKGILEVK